MEGDKVTKQERGVNHHTDYNLELARNPRLPETTRKQAISAVLIGQRIKSIIALAEITDIDLISGKTERFYRDKALDKITEKLGDKSLSKTEIIELRELEAKTALQQALEPETNSSWRGSLSSFANRLDESINIDESALCKLRKLAHGPTDTVWTKRVWSITHDSNTKQENSLYKLVMPLVNQNSDGSRTAFSYYLQAVDATIDAEMRKSANPDYGSALERIKERFNEAAYANHIDYLKSLKTISPEVRDALRSDAEYRTGLAKQFILDRDYQKAESVLDNIPNDSNVRVLRFGNNLLLAQNAESAGDMKKYAREAMISSIALTEIPGLGHDGIGKLAGDLKAKFPWDTDLIRPLLILEARNMILGQNKYIDGGGNKLKAALGVKPDFDLANSNQLINEIEKISDRKVQQSILLTSIEYLSAKSKENKKDGQAPKYSDQITDLAEKLQESFMESYAEKTSERTHDNLRRDITDALSNVWGIQLDNGCDKWRLNTSIHKAAEKLKFDFSENSNVKRMNEMKDKEENEKAKSENAGRLKRITDNPGEASRDDLNFAISKATDIETGKLKKLIETASTKNQSDGESGIDTLILLNAYMELYRRMEADPKSKNQLPLLVKNILSIAQAVYEDKHIKDHDVSQRVAEIILRLNSSGHIKAEVVKKRPSLLSRFFKKKD